MYQLLNGLTSFFPRPNKFRCLQELLGFPLFGYPKIAWLLEGQLLISLMTKSFIICRQCLYRRWENPGMKLIILLVLRNADVCGAWFEKCWYVLPLYAVHFNHCMLFFLWAQAGFFRGRMEIDAFINLSELHIFSEIWICKPMEI